MWRGVVSVAKQCIAADGPRRERYRRLLSHYENRDIAGLDANRYLYASELEEKRLVVNSGQSIVETVQARVGKSRPKATFITERGDYSVQRRARQCESFCTGIFDQSEFYNTRGLPLICRDAEVIGTGTAKVSDDVADEVGTIAIKRVHTWRVLVDPIEAHGGEPRNMYEYHPMDRRKLKALFPDKAKEIDKAPRDTGPGAEFSSKVDQVVVYEAWHLPSVPGADDGVHAMCIEGATLRVRPWKSQRFPFVFFHWNEPTAGFWGRSLLESIEKMDSAFNEILYQIDSAFWHSSARRIYVPRSANVEVSQFDNDLRVHIIKFDGQQIPVEDTPTPISPAYIQQAEWFRQGCYQQAGVSEQSAQSTKAPGVTSGRAIRELDDIEAGRFIIQGYGIEALVVQAAYRIIDAARRVDEAGADVSVRATKRKRRRSFVQSIKWSGVSMDEDAFVLRVFPTSALPDSPAYKIAAIEDLQASGLISPDQARSLIDFPDLDAEMGRMLAPYEIVLEQIERIVDEGEEQSPEPFQNLALCLQMMQAAYLQARMDGVEEERLELMRSYMTDAEEMLRASQAPAGTPPQAGEMPPATPDQPMAEEAVAA